MLSQKAKDELRAIYQEEFGDTLTDAEVEEQGRRLLRFFSLLLEKTNPTTVKCPPVDATD